MRLSQSYDVLKRTAHFTTLGLIADTLDAQPVRWLLLISRARLLQPPVASSIISFSLLEMIPAFGYSVGDFIATLNLAVTIVRAVQDSFGARVQYETIVTRLEDVKAAVELHAELDLLDARTRPKLQNAALHIEQSVEQFQKSIAPFHSLSQRDSTTRLVAALRRVHFALVKEHILELQADLLSQLTFIQLVLATVTNMAILKELADIGQRVIETGKQIQQIRSSQIRLSRYLAECATEFRQTLRKILKRTRLIQTVGLLLPAQIRFGKPLVLQDAFGEYLPIFLQPGECAVVKRNYKLQDGSISGKWLDVAIDQPFETTFRPGARWDQAMVFSLDPELGLRCPGFATHGHSDQAHTSEYDANAQGNKEDFESFEGAEDVQGELFDGPIQTTPVDVQIKAGGFCNVYLAQPPSMWLRDLEGCWLIVPWPLIHSLAQLQRIATLFGLAAATSDFVCLENTANDTICDLVCARALAFSARQSEAQTVECRSKGIYKDNN
ncbi:hypothetical protein HII31_02645 [Pseudocercospora fuligena]|uniref:Fungal N-terminal domain-containing protein n=1 Tax=Pseudocercospora fuligena TaxID=685502 RepID=A0A8H6VPR6_9PEZI|nr:hypothetical protein HII31_02645 [Pseudocercospora fuligena]